MAVKRGPDGVPVDVPTVMNNDNRPAANPKPGSSLFTGSEDATIPPPGKAPSYGSEDATMPPPGKSPGGSASSSLFPEDPPTVPADNLAGAAAASSQSDEPPTVIAGSNRAHVASGDPLFPSVDRDPMADPVVAWLVVTDGPGKGNYLKLGNGQNSIGRASGERVRVDFGDEQISRSNHAVLTFDPRGNTFFIQQGSGTNLAYLNNEPVLAPTALSAMSEIVLGETTLLFVPLCGEQFSWT